jgi:hypothetical protein
MWKRIVRLTICLTVVAGSIGAQGQPASGRYQIVGGEFRECCGIAGPFVHSLPYDAQTFVQLTAGPGGGARMSFLAEDGYTVFRTFSFWPGSGFLFSFSNGMVCANSVQFMMPAPPPSPSYACTVSNRADALLIHGVANVPCVGCADIPTQFEHNMAAVRIAEPLPVIDRIERGDGSLRFHFAGEPPNDYTVEYADSLAEPRWLPLTTYRAKLTAIDIVVTNSFTNASARFFRLRKEPCNCD